MSSRRPSLTEGLATQGADLAAAPSLDDEVSSAGEIEVPAPIAEQPTSSETLPVPAKASLPQSLRSPSISAVDRINKASPKVSTRITVPPLLARVPVGRAPVSASSASTGSGAPRTSVELPHSSGTSSSSTDKPAEVSTSLRSITAGFVVIPPGPYPAGRTIS